MGYKVGGKTAENDTKLANNEMNHRKTEKIALSFYDHISVFLSFI